MPCSANGGPLGSSDFFRGLDPAAVDKLRASATLRPLAAGATLLQQGGQPTHLYMLASGEVKSVHVTADGGQFALGYHQAGDLLGCVAVMRPMAHPVTAIAVQNCVVLGWTTVQTEAFLEEHPVVLRNATRIFCRQIDELLQGVRELTTERVEQRVARAVQRLVGSAGRKVLPCVARSLPDRVRTSPNSPGRPCSP